MKKRSSMSTLPDMMTASDVTVSYSGVVVTEMADYEEYDSTAATSTGLYLKLYKLHLDMHFMGSSHIGKYR